jgi:hypothetical protein
MIWWYSWTRPKVGKWPLPQSFPGVPPPEGDRHKSGDGVGVEGAADDAVTRVAVACWADSWGSNGSSGWTSSAMKHPVEGGCKSRSAQKSRPCSSFGSPLQVWSRSLKITTFPERSSALGKRTTPQHSGAATGNPGPVRVRTVSMSLRESLERSDRSNRG